MSDVSPVATYLARLDGRLVGPGRARRDLLREAGNHLEDAVEAYLHAGLPRADAEERAVADFGGLDEIATAFQSTLAITAARRTAWLLFAALALQALIWDGPIAIGHAADPAPDSAVYLALDAAVAIIGGLALVLALVLGAATGIGHRWFPIGNQLARTTSLVALAATTSVTLVAVAMAALSTNPDGQLWLLCTVSVLAPMTFVAGWARSTLATC